MHGGVDTAIALRIREVRGIGLNRHVVGLVPPVLVLHRHRVAQELLRARAVGSRRRGRSEHDEGVLVALLALARINRDTAALLIQLVTHGRVPAAVLVVPQHLGQGPHTMVGVATAAGNSHQRTEREGKGHAAGDPQLHRVVGVDRAVRTDPAESCRHARRTPVAQQRVGLLSQPAVVLRRTEPSQPHESSSTSHRSQGRRRRRLPG
ncbi:MAG: hypothetical protein Q605_AUC00754G0002 [Actinomyces urogenitalis DORA_12]|uniref:Uncharacterized protein n=1 Tax=Actinomyces urogenitalis DORA_12 TaxID=1403939 RepID=W1VIZ6_9ACTO|nr:MAG: hypothetical protein Q605_AUC00754G0002 [Actinomyces urogenitalis DORA_12]